MFLLHQPVSAQQKSMDEQKGTGFCGSEMSKQDWKAYKELAKAHRAHLAVVEQISLPLIEIPVVFHILRNLSGEGVTIEQVNQALTWVNEKYAPADIHFFQCQPPDIIVNDEWFNTTFLLEWENTCGAPTLEYQLDQGFHVDDVINIYCVNTNGWSWSAGTSAITERCMDWVIFHQGHIDNRWLLAHELGHYFNLPHTFSGIFANEPGEDDENVTRNPNNSCYNCEEEGDLFCDTPADYHNNDSLGWNSGCVPDIAFDACGVLLQPDGLNLMSYSNSACSAEAKFFSPEQRSRMYFVLTNGRSYLDCNSDCENGLILSGEHLSNRTYRSNSFIESSAEVYPNDYAVTYQAETYIDLNIGFRATANSIFIARLANCIDDEFAGTPIERNFTRSQNVKNGHVEELEMSVSPNPFSRNFLITFTLLHPDTISLRLLDALGKPCRIILAGEDKEAGTYSFNIGTEGLSNGLYFLEINAGQDRQVQKVVKLHH